MILMETLHFLNSFQHSGVKKQTGILVFVWT